MRSLWNAASVEQSASVVWVGGSREGERERQAELLRKRKGGRGRARRRRCRPRPLIRLATIRQHRKTDGKFFCPQTLMKKISFEQVRK